MYCLVSAPCLCILLVSLLLLPTITPYTAELKQTSTPQRAGHELCCHACRLAGNQAAQPNGIADNAPNNDSDVLPGPPPQPQTQQPWLPQTAPAVHPNGAHPMHSVAPGAAYQGYVAEYYLPHPGAFPSAHLQPPAAVKPAAEDDRCACKPSIVCCP